MQAESDKVFAGSIPQVYEENLVPLIFQPYAEDLVQRLRGRPLSRILEIAAGTGVVTRAMAAGLAPQASIVATDLNPAMLEQARKRGTSRPVEWKQADAMSLPFSDGEFDAVVCQFGAMFFPDKPKAFAETRRVLKPNGVFIFSVWDRIEENEFADAVTGTVAKLFPRDPPRFLARTPHGYADRAAIEAHLAQGGFTHRPEIEAVAARSVASSPRTVAVGYCQGTPLRNEIEARDASRLEEATSAAEEAIGARYGRGTVDAKIQALVVTVRP